jgi:hypothetical protein
MKHKILVLALAASPALFAGDLHRDYNNLARQNADIRHDQRQLRKDLERGHYRDVARVRRDLERDYAARNARRREIRRDEYERRWR